MVVFFNTNAWGQELANTSLKNSNFSVGLAFINSDQVYINDKRVARLMPYLSFESNNFRFSLREGATYKAVTEEDYSIELSVLPNFQPYKSSDSIHLDGMNRALTFDGLVSFSYSLKRGLDINQKIATELSNEFKGHMADLSLSQFIPIFGIPCVLKGGAKWYDQNRAQYFYGVYEDEERVGRLKHDINSFIMPYYSFNLFYSLNSNTTLFGNLNTNFLSSKVINSPIVEKETSNSVVLGIGCNFQLGFCSVELDL